MPKAIPALRLPRQHATSIGLRRQRTEVSGYSQGSRTPWLLVQVRRCTEDGQAGSRRVCATQGRRGAKAPRQAQVLSGHRRQSGSCYLLRCAPAARMQVCATVGTPSSKPMQSCQVRTVLKPLGACASTRCLTLRSSRAPTAGHAGQQAPGLRPILRLLSSASHRRCRLNSNVRPRNQPPCKLPQP